MNENDGMALILTVLIVSLIVALTLQFNKTMWSNLYAATNSKDGFKIGCIARSGLNGALAILYEDSVSGDVDTLREVWANTLIFSKGSAYLFDEGQFNVRIADLSGKIQINRLIDENGKYDETQKSILTRFLRLPEFELDSEKVDNIVDAIKDWLDSDSDTTGFGAENSYYKMLERPYPCKNNSFEFLEELLLVRGITRDLFYGRVEKPGISNYISVHGDGKININTASSLVLMSLADEIDGERAENMTAYRDNEENDISSSKWYKKVPGMADITMPDNILTTSSTYFEIFSEGSKGEMSKQIKAIVKKEKKRIKVLSLKAG